MTNAVSFCHALSDATRWRIVRLAMNEALCICELGDILGMPQSSVSSHVQVLRKAGLLESEKCGKWTYFRIETAYLTLIRSLERFFEKTTPPEWAADADRATARLAARDESCCPRPTRLKPRRPRLSPATQPV